MKEILSNDVDSAKAFSSKRTNKRKKQRKALLTIEDIRANHLRRRLSRKTERRRSKKVPTAGTQPKTISVIKKTYQRKRKLAKDGNVEVAKRKRKSNVTYRSKPFTTRNLKEIGFSYAQATDVACLSDIGKMNEVCSFCGALKFKMENPSLCCSQGRIKIPFLECNSPYLKSLYDGTHSSSNHFLQKIRSYNSCFQMTSFGANIKRIDGYNPSFTVQGQVYHRIGSVQPETDKQPQFLQIYFIKSSDDQADIRQHHIPGTQLSIIKDIQEELLIQNPYVQCFTSMRDADYPELNIVIKADRELPKSQGHKGRFNKPSATEVAAILSTDTVQKRDIVIKSKESSLQTISELNKAYDGLQYPLLYIHGEDGYHLGMKGDRRSRCSTMDFYSYRLMIRKEFSHLHRARDLFQQFIVDIYSKVESERLSFIRYNQGKLRAETYQNVKDAVQKSDHETVGKRVILPSTFMGSPRFYHEKAMDAMTYVRVYGRPDLFITFTSNPKWPEITENLLPHQTPGDRPDIIARVFKQKGNCLLQLLTKHQVFGESVAHVYSVEWQKRGLPHIHLLLWLKEKIHPSQIDEIISAELPDENTDPELFKTVSTQMVHGPCGIFNRTSACMVDNKCIRRYPRSFTPATQTNDDGYPLYKRRSPDQGGHTVQLKRGTVDNRWVVPYSPLLCKIFKAHINVEFANSVKAIKYVCKYIFKGPDCAAFEIRQNDEVQLYQVGRYLSSHESCWRLFGFEIHARHPSVEHLQIHLEHQHKLYFIEGKEEQAVSNEQVTTLTGFFDLCKVDDFARSLLYIDVPKYYIWSKKKWRRRKRGIPVQEKIFRSQVLGRMYTVHPSAQELYFLRMLLLRVEGPTDFKDVRTVETVTYNTYREAL